MYIEREALMQQVKAVHKAVDTSAVNLDYNTGFHSATSQVQGMIAEQPTADVAPVVHGQWVQSGQCNHKPYRIRNTDKWTTYKCSVCGFRNGRRFNDKFCSNCGAKMDGGTP